MTWTDPQLVGAPGILRDIDPDILPPEAWETGQNVRFDSQAVRPMPGWEQYFLPQVTPRRLFPLDHPVEPEYYWTYPGDTTVYTFDGTAHTDITLAAGLSFSVQWTGDYINSNLVLSNGADAPMYWPMDPAQNLQVLPDLDTLESCRVLLQHRGFLIALDTVEGGVRRPYRFKWSDAAPTGLPLTWNPVGSLAGSVDLGHDSALLVAALPLRDNLIVYGDHKTWDVSFVGGEFVWRFSPLFDSIGCLGNQAVAEFEGRHLVLTDGDLIAHDGYRPQSVIDDANRHWLFDNISDTYAGNSIIVRDFTTDEMLIAVPQQGEEFPTRALAWNFRENSWGIRDLPPSCRSLANTQDLSTSEQQTDPVPARANPAIRRLITATPTAVRRLAGSTQDGTSMPVSVERSGLNFGPGYHQVNRLRLVAEGDPFTVEVGAQVDLGGQIQWQRPKTFTPGRDRHLQTRALGLRHALRFSDTAGGDWRVFSYTADVEQEGDR